MNRILTIFVALHWTVVFAALAVLAGLHGGENLPAVLAAIGIDFPVGWLPTLVPAALCAVLSIGFGTVAALFLWMLVTGMVGSPNQGEVDDVARLAFGGGVAVMTMVFIGCASAPDVSGFYPPLAIELGALLASYLAVCAERRMAVAASRRKRNTLGAAARNMALHAAHESLADRLMGGRRSEEPR